MFTTITQVKELTGYDVTNELLFQAQAIVEMFSNRQEADVDLGSDREALGRATAYQAAYMSKNYETIFEQVAVLGISGTDSSMTFDVTMGAPYLAPLAVLSLRGLSKRGTRSIRFGAMFGKPQRKTWERD